MSHIITTANGERIKCPFCDKGVYITCPVTLKNYIFSNLFKNDITKIKQVFFTNLDKDNDPTSVITSVPFYKPSFKEDYTNKEHIYHILSKVIGRLRSKHIIYIKGSNNDDNLALALTIMARYFQFGRFGVVTGGDSQTDLIEMTPNEYIDSILNNDQQVPSKNPLILRPTNFNSLRESPKSILADNLINNRGSFKFPVIIIGSKNSGNFPENTEDLLTITLVDKHFSFDNPEPILNMDLTKIEQDILNKYSVMTTQTQESVLLG